MDCLGGENNTEEREYPDTWIVLVSGDLGQVNPPRRVFSTTSLVVSLLLVEILHRDMLTETEEIAFQAAREVGTIATKHEARRRLDRDDDCGLCMDSYSYNESDTFR